MRLKAFVLSLCIALACQLQAAERGPFSPEASQWDATVKAQQRAAGTKLLQDLAAAVASRAATFDIPKGHYRFASPVGSATAHVRISGASNLVINGNGSTFWFETGSTGLNVDKSTNVTVKNLMLDWDPLPFTQGHIVSVDSNTSTVKFKVDPGYDRVTPAFKNLVNSTSLASSSRLRFQLIDPVTRRFKRGQVGMRIDPFWATRDANGVYTTKVYPFVSGRLSALGVKAGDTFVSLYRDSHAVYVSTCDRCTFEDVTLYASPFIGFAEAATEGRTTYRRCRIIPSGDTNRYLGGNADGINITNAREGPIIDQCQIESIGDDFVNSHGMYYRVLAQESPTTIVVDRMGYRGSISGNVTVNFLTRNAWGDLGTRTASVTTTTYTYRGATSLLKTATNWQSGGLGSLPAEGASVSAHRLVLDAPITLPTDSVLACSTFTSDHAVITGNRFINCIATGIRLQAPNTLIDSNHLEWTGNGLVHLQTQPDKWGESTHPDNTTVSNNLLVSPYIFLMSPDSTDYAVAVSSPGDLSKSRWVSDITIRGNIFRDIPLNAVRVLGGRSIVLEDNRIQSYGNATNASFTATPLSSTRGYAFYLSNVLGLVNTGNQISGAGPRAGSTPIYQNNVK